ncbi:MAG: hypothetical protein HY830_21725 [Actinobacteria bacterium]|nr:hypothetical protein [Actinomycetota bacterium]
MALYIVLLDEMGTRVRDVPDPDGGTFDAAGDFDTLLDLAGPWQMWSRLDPYEDTELDHEQAALLLSDIARLRPLAQTGIETRGLDRLAALASICTHRPGYTLRFDGD